MDGDGTATAGRALVVAAHADDEALGCGGTMARLARDGWEVRVLLLADGETSRLADPGRADRVDARHAAATEACALLGAAGVDVIGLPDNRLDSVVLLDVVRYVEGAVERHQPSMVLTHFAGDVNVDHRVAHDAVMAACRPQPGHPVRDLLFFEVPSSTEWRPAGSAGGFEPNWFVDISDTLDRKLRALEVYKDELRQFPHPRSLRAVEALARWRGATVGVDAAEAFVLGRHITR